MLKINFEGNEGVINGYAFKFLGRIWLFAFSETKWHSGEKYKKAPIWFSKIRDVIPAIFIWKLAIGCATVEQLKKSRENKEPLRSDTNEND